MKITKKKVLYDKHRDVIDSKHDLYEHTHEEKKISLIFDLDEFTNEEIANILFDINKLYKSIGGDEIIIQNPLLFYESDK